jgi:uncharacterized protein YrrD
VSDRFAAASGRRVVSRASAEELGNLAHVVVDVKRRQVASLVVGEGRNALLVGWEQVSGFGPDAVVIAEESALRPPRDDRERAAADGKLELVGKRALSDMGDDLGTVSDVLFRPCDRRHRDSGARRPRGASGVAPGSRLVRRGRSSAG